MAQHDYEILNQPGLEFRTDINAALAAIRSLNSGDIEPSAKFAGMMWLDTGVGTDGILKLRNQADDGWIVAIDLDNPPPEDAPADDKVKGRLNNAWVDLPEVETGPATGLVEIGDAPPASPVEQSLWWQSNTGGLFLRYRDVDTVQWVQVNGGAAVTSAGSYDLAFVYEPVTANNTTIGRFLGARPFTVPVGAAGSQAKAGTAATAASTYTLKKNGTAFGTVVFTGTAGVFTVASATAFAAGDMLTIDGPATGDATLAGIAIVLVTTP